MTEERSPDAGASGQDDDQAASPEEDDAREPGFLARLLGFNNGHGHAEADGAPDSGETANERALLSNIRTMRGQRVEDIMIPRADIAAVEVGATLAELAEAFRAGAHSRLPVYRDTLDDPIGFIHVKDVALARGFANGACPAPFRIEEFIREMLAVPPSMLTGRLMQRMQQRRIHMALVIDEYGGVDGLVTIEDLVEQIVGDIEDEHDEADEAPWRREAPGVYVCNARAELPEFEAEAGVDLLPDDLDEEVDTLGGLVSMISNRVPERGEVISHPDGHEFEVIDADPRRIKRIRIRLRGAGREAAKAGE